MIGDSTATCFSLNDDIYLKSKDKAFKVVFDIVEGRAKEGLGKWMGHVKFGVRPGQLEQKPLGAATDWQVYLRNLDIPDGTILRCTLKTL